MTREIALILALGCLAGPALAQDLTGERYYRAFEQAEEALRARDFDRGLAQLEALARVTPGNTDLWLTLANAYARADKQIESIDAGRRAIALGSRTAPWFIAYRIAGAFGRRGDGDSALAWIDRTLALGWGDRPRFNEHDAFESLRADPRFVRLVGTLPTAPLGREAGWRFDLDYLLEEVRRLHPGPHLPNLPPDVERIIADVRSRVGDLSDDEIMLHLQRAISALGDGHSWITSSGGDPSDGSGVAFDTRRLPFRFYLFTDGLYIVRATPQYAEFIGSRVDRFGSMDAADAVEAIAPYLARDNEHGLRGAAPGLLRSPLHLHAIGAIEDADEVALALMTPDGRTETVRVEGGDNTLDWLLGPPESSNPVPLHLQQRDKAHWVTTLPDHDAVYFQFNSVRNAPGLPSLRRLGGELRQTLEDTDAKNLIIDVRYNGGGNNTLLRGLLRTLVWWDVAAEDHQIYLITGRRTFSAAQNFVNRVERMTDVIIAGEPSGSRPNFVGETSRLELPFSGLRGSISNRYWQDSDSGDERRWIAPHIPVQLSSEDYFANRDPVVDAVLTVIEGREE